MSHVTADVECQIVDSFRVQQVAGLFDVPLAERSTASFQVEVPDLSDDWTIGAIVGPSGSGKTTIARKAFGQHFYEPASWDQKRAVIDGFGERSIREITQTLTTVGFSSPPAWLKPFHVLSNGEQFRCNLARALLGDQSVIVYDEFTSVVDRTVAQIASAAVSRTLRKQEDKKRLVVVSCHYDILPWLEPDWHLDMATCELKRGRLRRPCLALDVVRCRSSAWKLFARHHYLSGNLPGATRCYLALWNKQPVAFAAIAALYGFKGRRRVSRIVTLPDYQGIGIGARFLDRVSQLEKEAGHRVNITASHPAIIGYCRRSPHWRTVRVAKTGQGGRHKTENTTFDSAHRRNVVSFEYIATTVATGA